MITARTSDAFSSTHLKAVMVGGGGTDFRPVFEHIEKNRVPVDVVVYLTDGYGNFGGDPGIETIWVMTTHEVPPWGNHIQIGVDS